MNITLDKNDEQLTGLLTVNMTEADYAAAVEKQLKDYTKRAQIKGFRPGKVPVGVVKKMYGRDILIEEVNKLLGKNVDAYLQENKVNLLGDPVPVPSKADFDTDKDFSFQFELGLLPEFTLPAGLEVELHQVSLDDDTVGADQRADYPSVWRNH